MQSGANSSLRFKAFYKAIPYTQDWSAITRYLRSEKKLQTKLICVQVEFVVLFIEHLQSPSIEVHSFANWKLI